VRGLLAVCSVPFPTVSISLLSAVAGQRFTLGRVECRLDSDLVE